MTTFKPEEFNLLKKYANQAKNVLEFGVGESTELFNGSESVSNIVSVESDRQWLMKMVLKDLQKVDFAYVEVGAIPNEFGTPHADYKKVWSYYSDQALRVSNIDTVFVDGRFRVACMLKSFISCNDDCVFLIHDYTRRDHYFVVENFFEIVESAGSLVVFKKRSDYDKDLLAQCIKDFENDWR